MRAVELAVRAYVSPASVFVSLTKTFLRPFPHTSARVHEPSATPRLPDDSRPARGPLAQDPLTPPTALTRDQTCARLVAIISR